MGGFECASHLRADRRRLDVVAGSRHDVCCAEDYRLLAEAGVRTVRDGLRWHLIEQRPGVYDWSSFVPMLGAARATGMQVIWDLCHWGVPDWLDVFAPEFPGRFAAFARAAATVIAGESRDAAAMGGFAGAGSSGGAGSSEDAGSLEVAGSFAGVAGAAGAGSSGGAGSSAHAGSCAKAGEDSLRREVAAVGGAGENWYVPVNEISFWSWVGGETAFFGPFGAGRGPEMKRQLVRASIGAMRAIREVDAGARFVQPEPAIHIAAGTRQHSAVEAAERHTEAQFEVWDMLAGRRDPELGGGESLLDVLGVNYYWNNQWVHEGERTPPGHSKHQPLHTMMEAIAVRYGRPMMLTETGTEGDAQAGWLGYVMAEVRAAQRAGARVEGVCLYPVMDYPGWDNDRHCPCGLIEVGRQWGERTLREELAAELRVQQRMLEVARSKG